jgi:YVTN family beta-propeller protein
MNIFSARRVAVVCGAALLTLLPAAGATAGAAAASPPQRRQIAETTLTDFKVVLTVTRVGTGLKGTVTAAGYQNTAGNWTLTGQRQIGAAGQWFWYSTKVCGLTVTELKPLPSTAATSDALTVSLLITPALGCSRNYSESWGASPSAPTAYVVDTGTFALSDTVTAINTATSKVLKSIRVGYGPNAIAIAPNGKTAYVASGGQTCGTCSPEPPPASTVTPISTATNTALKPIKVAPYPDAIAITPNGKTAYVASHRSDTVTPIDTTTNTALKPIKLAGSPGAIAITPNGKTAYVATGEYTVTPISTATNTTLKPITVGNGPEAIAITPNGKTAYVVNVFSGTVTPIDTATNAALKAIKIGNPIKAAGYVGASTIVITPDGKTAYISDPSTDPSAAAQVTPIATATNTALRPIKVGGFPEATAITPNGEILYVLTSTGVTPIRTAVNTAGASIALKRTATGIGIVVTPDGGTAYIVQDDLAGNLPGTVIPLRTATGTLGTPIPVGIGPGAIAITP